MTKVVKHNGHTIVEIAARIAAEQDNLENARAFARAGRIFRRRTKFVEDDFDDALKLALLRGGKMIDVGAHRPANLRAIADH